MIDTILALPVALKAAMMILCKATAICIKPTLPQLWHPVPHTPEGTHTTHKDNSEGINATAREPHEQ
eukprot:12683435-Alexandrium_andersonii.AAC.1